MIMDLDTALTWLPVLLRAALVTVELTLATLLLGMLIAVPIALCRNAHNLVARWFAIAFVFVFRGAPLLALLYVIYYGLPEVAALRNGWAWAILGRPFPCAVLALSLNSAGYLSEILAGAMRLVPRGEIEAAMAIGIGRLAVLRHILIPHTARLALRSYGNEIVFVIKGTSVASLVTVRELLSGASEIYFNVFDPITPYVTAGLLYLVMVFAALRAIGFAERRLSPELRVRRGSGVKQAAALLVRR
jgi:His/Glu/Gln/Arg/opine family amino acid ABC transporter permease subunit